MQKEKKVRKLIPVEYEDKFSLEEYFRHMSLMGLHFEKFFGYGIFIKGENIGYRYRAEPINTSRAWPDHEKMCHYEECGWEFVNKFGNMYEVYRTEPDNDAELHTDPVAESYGYENILKRMKWDVICMSIYNILLVAGIFGIYFFAPSPVLLLVESASFILPIAAISLIFSMAGSVRKYNKIKRIKDILHCGENVREEGKINYKSRFRTFMDFWGNVLMCAVLIFLLVSHFSGDIHVSIDEADFDIPYVPIEVLCDDEGFYVPEKDFVINGVDACSHVRRENSALAKDIFHIWESGYIENDGEYNVNGEFPADHFVTSDTDVYILHTKALSFHLVEDIMGSKEDFEFTEIVDGRFDHVYVGYYESSQNIIAAKDEKVISVLFRVDMHGSVEKYDITEKLESVAGAIR